ncbi:hypothetical protein Gotur_008280 [Gossypium turneri]
MNTSNKKGIKFFGCLKFKEGTNTTAKEEGCTINRIMLENKMLLTENKRLRLENDELNIDEMRKM